MTTKWVACSPSMTCASQYACTQTNRAEGRDRRGCGTMRSIFPAWKQIATANTSTYRGGLSQDGKASVFATADERTYPKLLCKRIAAQVLRHAAKIGIAPIPAISASATRKQLVGKQPRGTRGTELIPEFQLITLLSLTRRRTTKPCSVGRFFFKTLHHWRFACASER
jgi:hypothetical protein